MTWLKIEVELSVPTFTNILIVLGMLLDVIFDYMI